MKLRILFVLFLVAMIPAVSFTADPPRQLFRDYVLALPEDMVGTGTSYLYEVDEDGVATGRKVLISTVLAVPHNHVASQITSGTLDGDRLPGISATKRGGVPATGIPSGSFLRDDDSWGTPSPSAHVHAASEVTSGTLDAARIPDLSASYLPAPSNPAAGQFYQYLSSWGKSEYKLPASICTSGYGFLSNGTDMVCSPISGGGAGDLKADGTVPLTADWDAGNHNLKAGSFSTYKTSGTAGQNCTFSSYLTDEYGICDEGPDDHRTGNLLLKYPDGSPSENSVRVQAATASSRSLSSWYPVKIDLAGNSDTNLVSQKAVKTAVDGKVDKTQKITQCATIKGTVDADDYPLWKLPHAVTIQAMNCYSSGDNVVGSLDECTGTGGICSGVTTVVADVTCTADTNVATTSFTNAGIAAGNWIRWHTTSHTGTNTFLSVCVDYTVD